MQGAAPADKSLIILQLVTFEALKQQAQEATQLQQQKAIAEHVLGSSITQHKQLMRMVNTNMHFLPSCLHGLPWLQQILTHTHAWLAATNLC